MIKFLHYVPAEETMEFENNFEPQFRLTIENKKEFLAKCETTWLFVDNQIAAEIYSIPVSILVNEPTPEKDDENIKADITPYLNKAAAYYYSASILPNYRKQGLLKPLVDFHNQYLAICGFKIGLAHSTANGIETLAEHLNAKQLNYRENWFGSQRISRFYEFEISQKPSPRTKTCR